MRKFSLMSLCNASTAWYSMVHVKTFWQWIRKLRWWMITEIKNVNTRDFNNQTKRGFSGNRIRLFFKWGFLFTLYVDNNLTSVNCSRSADGKLLVTLPTRPPTPMQPIYWIYLFPRLLLYPNKDRFSTHFDHQRYYFPFLQIWVEITASNRKWNPVAKG